MLCGTSRRALAAALDAFNVVPRITHLRAGRCALIGFGGRVRRVQSLEMT